MTSFYQRLSFRVCNSKFTKILIDQITFIKSNFIIYRKRLKGRELLKTALFELIEYFSLS